MRNHQSYMHRIRVAPSGFTLVELVIVIVITGILLTVALSGARRVSDTLRFEQARSEMNRLAEAIAGNPEFKNNGVRCDFGYVGDVGALPVTLDALMINPGGYTTWLGPYLSGRILQSADDFKTDPWGNPYTISNSAIVSTGSGTTISRPFAVSPEALLYNQVEGNVLDYDGTPPGTDFADSITVFLTYPDGVGGMTSQSTSPDRGGFFRCDSIPIGIHALNIVYEPSNDTLERIVVVSPGASVYRAAPMSGDIWYDTVAVSGTIAHYRFDELSGSVAIDASGNANDGNLQNMSGSEWTPGVVGGSLLFDGDDDHVSTPASASDLILSGDYSTSLWMKPGASQKAWAGVYAKANPSGSQTHWNLQFDNSSGRELIVYHGNQRWNSGLLLADVAGEWHHMSVVREGISMRLYLNGALFSSGGFVDDPGSTNGRLYIGTDQSGSSTGAFQGQIDDLRIFDRPLSEAEVRQLYGAGV